MDLDNEGVGLNAYNPDIPDPYAANGLQASIRDEVRLLKEKDTLARWILDRMEKRLPPTPDMLMSQLSTGYAELIEVEEIPVEDWEKNLEEQPLRAKQDEAFARRRDEEKERKREEKMSKGWITKPGQDKDDEAASKPKNIWSKQAGNRFTEKGTGADDDDFAGVEGMGFKNRSQSRDNKFDRNTSARSDRGRGGNRGGDRGRSFDGGRGGSRGRGSDRSRGGSRGRGSDRGRGGGRGFDRDRSSSRGRGSDRGGMRSRGGRGGGFSSRGGPSSRPGGSRGGRGSFGSSRGGGFQRGRGSSPGSRGRGSSRGSRR